MKIKKPCFWYPPYNHPLHCDDNEEEECWGGKDWESCKYGKKSPHYAEWRERHEDEKTL
jgi:hypothetical protein